MSDSDSDIQYESEVSDSEDTFTNHRDDSSSGAEKSVGMYVRKRKEVPDSENTLATPKSKRQKANLISKKKKTIKREKHSVQTNGDAETSENDNATESEENPSTTGEISSNSENQRKQKEDINLYKDRTLFVGNVSITCTKHQLKKLFEKFGKVEAVRFRCVPTADSRTPKKVALIKKEFHPDRKALHSFVRFTNREDALKAVVLNGHIFKGLHIRVNICDEPEKCNITKAIFVGNVPFDAEEEELWTIFEACGEIESVRLIRDRRTNIGKGFGYVNFKSTDSVELALQMEDLKLKSRILRVTSCKADKTSKMKQSKVAGRLKTKSSESVRRRDAQRNIQTSSKIVESDKNDKAVKPGQSAVFQGKKFTDKKKKNKFDKGAYKKKTLIKQIAPRIPLAPRD